MLLPCWWQSGQTIRDRSWISKQMQLQPLHLTRRENKVLFSSKSCQLGGFAFTIFILGCPRKSYMLHQWTYEWYLYYLYKPDLSFLFLIQLIIKNSPYCYSHFKMVCTPHRRCRKAVTFQLHSVERINMIYWLTGC